MRASRPKNIDVTNAAQGQKEKGLAETNPLELFGSPTWTRTRDLRINSPSLYQLSYQGIVKVHIIIGHHWLVNQY